MTTAHLLLLAAESREALDGLTAVLADYLRQNPAVDLADVAYTLQTNLPNQPHRRFAVCQSVAEAIEVLDAPTPPRAFTHTADLMVRRSVAFLFPGVGDHYLGMARELYEGEPLFRAVVEECNAVLEPYLGESVTDLLYPPQEQPAAPSSEPAKLDLRAMLRRNTPALSPAEQKLQATAVAQPIVFVVDYALARLLMSWGIEPKSLIGYSLGEYVAACLAGVLSLPNALKLVAERARLIQESPGGSMLTVPLSVTAVQPHLSATVCLAAHNGEATCVLAGPTPDIQAIGAALQAQGVASRPLDTTHAFHSTMLQPLAGPLTQLTESLPAQFPRKQLISNVTGQWLTPEQATDPGYWAQHMCQTVRFFEGLNTLLTDQPQFLLEVGPGQSLGAFAKQHPACQREQVAMILPTLRYSYDKKPDRAFLWESLGKMWLLGLAPNWPALSAGQTRQTLPLPEELLAPSSENAPSQVQERLARGEKRREQLKRGKR